MQLPTITQVPHKTEALESQPMVSQVGRSQSKSAYNERITDTLWEQAPITKGHGKNKMRLTPLLLARNNKGPRITFQNRFSALRETGSQGQLAQTNYAIN